MNINSEHIPSAPESCSDVPAKVREFMAQYQPRILTAGQKEVMLDDIKAAVLRTAPPSVVVARLIVGSVCKFVNGVAPAAGCPLGDVLTQAQLTWWTAARKRELGVGRTLTQEVGRVKKVLRVQGGLPAVMNVNRSRGLAAPPLDAAAFERLRDRCVAAGGPVLRGFVAGFGAGVLGAGALGSVFVEVDGELWLQAPSGVRQPVLVELQDSRLAGEPVRDGDWDEVVRVAASLRTYLAPAMVLQTRRERAVFEDRPVLSMMVRYAMRGDTLDAVIPYLAPVDLAADVAAAAAVRGWSIDATMMPGSAM
jgi:hypothetical protein